MIKGPVTNLDRLASRLRSAGDPNRLRILKILMSRERICVSEVADELGLSVAIVSHHMQALAKEKMVLPERQGKRICYIPQKDEFMEKLSRLIKEVE